MQELISVVEEITDFTLWISKPLTKTWQKRNWNGKSNATICLSLVGAESVSPIWYRWSHWKEETFREFREAIKIL
jgi:hypothetical protein